MYFDYQFGDRTALFYIGGILVTLLGLYLAFTGWLIAGLVIYVGVLFRLSGADAILFGKAHKQMPLKDEMQRAVGTAWAAKSIEGFEEAPEWVDKAEKAYRVFQKPYNFEWIILATVFGGWQVGLALAVSLIFGVHDQLYYRALQHDDSNPDRERGWMYWTPWGFLKGLLFKEPITARECNIQAVVAVVLSLWIMYYDLFIAKAITLFHIIVEILPF